MKCAAALLLLCDPAPGLAPAAGGGHPGTADSPVDRCVTRRAHGLLGNPDCRPGHREAGLRTQCGSSTSCRRPTTKLFTTALALKRLGPDLHVPHRGARWMPGGSICGWWAAAIPTFPIAPFRIAWAGRRQSPAGHRGSGRPGRGARHKRISGDVIGDDSAYVWQPYAARLGVSTIRIWDYGAPASASPSTTIRSP